jgi:uncharacterized protein involved in type VI secretion and phage assembly
MNFLEILRPAGDSRGGRIEGVVVGIVTNNQDPEGLGRVRVKFPWLNETDEGPWARIATPMAGDQRGMFFLPEVGDEVLVSFEQGDPRFPYVIGALWNGKDKPPEANADGHNDVRLIRSRSGHVIRFTDKAGGELLEIIDSSGNNKISIDSAANKIVISSSGGTISLQAGKIEISADASVDVKGAVINLN